MSDNDTLRERWALTLGSDGAATGWKDHDPSITCKPSQEPAATHLAAATLSGLGTLGDGTLSGRPTLAGGTLSGRATLGDADGGGGGGQPGTAGFDLEQQIGKGGMGVVFKARQRSLQREIAVKFIRSDAASPSAKEAFVAEALVNGLLDHPNIVPVHELGQSAEGEVYLAMKLVGGTSWSDLLHPRSDEHRRVAAAYDLDRHLTILHSVANAVAFAHAKGIVHRDLKPDNVMVGTFGEVLVMDWGIAVDIRDQPGDDQRTRHKSSVTAPSGTPSYLPPELAEGRGHDIGPWTDTYLLGAILHELLTGQPPHRGASLLAVLLAAAESRPPTFPASVPAGLAAICTKALAKHHRDRFRNVAELQDALRLYEKHRESEKVATTARAALDRATNTAQQQARYGAYAEAIAGFRQAIALWDGNADARTGERGARLTYARTAREAGDLGLAGAQLDGLADGTDLHAERTALDAAHTAAKAREQTAKRNKLLLIGSVVIIVIGLGIGFLLVTAEQARTKVQRDKALDNERLANEQKTEADKQRDLAQGESWRAKNLAAAGLYRESRPILQVETAVALQIANDLHPDRAPAHVDSAHSLAHDAWWRYAYAERPVITSVWESAAPGPISDVILSDDAVVVIIADGGAAVYSLATGELRCTLNGFSTGKDFTPGLMQVATNTALLAEPDGSDLRVRAWSLLDGKVIHDVVHEQFDAASPTPDGTAMVLANINLIQAVALADNRILQIPDAELASELLLSEEGRVLRVQALGDPFDDSFHRPVLVHALIWDTQRTPVVGETAGERIIVWGPDHSINTSSLSMRGINSREPAPFTVPGTVLSAREGLCFELFPEELFNLAPARGVSVWDRRTGANGIWAAIAQDGRRMQVYTIAYETRKTTLVRCDSTLTLEYGMTNRDGSQIIGLFSDIERTITDYKKDNHIIALRPTDGKSLWSVAVPPACKFLSAKATDAQRSHLAVAYSRHENEDLSRIDAVGAPAPDDVCAMIIDTARGAPITLGDALPSGWISALAVNGSKHRLVASAGDDVVLIDFSTPVPQRLGVVTGGATALAWSDDADALAKVDRQNRLFICDGKTLAIRTLVDLGDAKPSALVYCANGHLLAGDANGSLWRIGSAGEVIERLAIGLPVKTIELGINQHLVWINSSHLINLHDSRVLYRMSWGLGILSSDQRKVYDFRSEEAASLRITDLIPDELPSVLPPLTQHEEDWQRLLQRERYTIADSGPWQGLPVLRP